MLDRGDQCVNHQLSGSSTAPSLFQLKYPKHSKQLENLAYSALKIPISYGFGKYFLNHLFFTSKFLHLCQEEYAWDFHPAILHYNTQIIKSERSKIKFMLFIFNKNFIQESRSEFLPQIQRMCQAMMMGVTFGPPLNQYNRSFDSFVLIYWLPLHAYRWLPSPSESFCPTFYRPIEAMTCQSYTCLASHILSM